MKWLLKIMHHKCMREGAEQGWGGAHFVKLPTFII